MLDEGLMEHADALDLLGRILEHTRVATTVVDGEGRLTCFNQAAERLTGYRREEVLGSPVGRFYSSAAELQQMWQRVQADGKLEDYETTLVNKAGQHIPVSIVLVELRDAAGRPMGSLGLTLDLTERHRLEGELAAAKQRVDFCNALICHDMRNYIQTTHGFLAHLISGQAGPVTDEQRRLLQICRRQLGRANDLIHRVTLLTELEGAAAVSLHAEPLTPLLERVAVAVQECYADRRPEMVLTPPPGEAPAVRASALLFELVYNLVSNAVAHNPSTPPRVWISAIRPGPAAPGCWHLRVEDDGPGVEPARREEIFDRFQELRTRGAGTGLSLVQALAERFGGRVWVEDRVAGAPGRGARFVVELRDAAEARPIC